MTDSTSVQLRAMAWNIGFGSRKADFISSDSDRAQEILNIAATFKVDAIALQEMANREYSIGLPAFSLAEYFHQNDNRLNSIFFLPTVSLAKRHCYPYGKLPQVNSSSGVSWLEYGPGVWIRNVNSWYLRNLYGDANEYLAAVEVQRPIPHPLYMAEKPKVSAGRDEEDRPVLWSRLDKLNCDLKNVKIYFVSLHLPTLKNEEKGFPEGKLTESQKDIALNVLNLTDDDILGYTIDKLASEFRQYFLRHIVSQANRIEQYWISENSNNRCIFILSGDFNFYHTNDVYADKKPEEIFLEQEGFIRTKLRGFSRPGGRLVDNIWVKGQAKTREYLVNGTQIEQSAHGKLLKTISDHYPVVADIRFKVGD